MSNVEPDSEAEKLTGKNLTGRTSDRKLSCNKQSCKQESVNDARSNKEELSGQQKMLKLSYHRHVILLKVRLCEIDRRKAHQLKGSIFYISWKIKKAQEREKEEIADSDSEYGPSSDSDAYLFGKQQKVDIVSHCKHPILLNDKQCNKLIRSNERITIALWSWSGKKESEESAHWVWSVPEKSKIMFWMLQVISFLIKPAANWSSFCFCVCLGLLLQLNELAFYHWCIFVFCDLLLSAVRYIVYDKSWKHYVEFMFTFVNVETSFCLIILVHRVVFMNLFHFRRVLSLEIVLVCSFESKLVFYC